jgi:hypothetical protein
MDATKLPTRAERAWRGIEPCLRQLLARQLGTPAIDGIQARMRQVVSVVDMVAPPVNVTVPADLVPALNEALRELEGGLQRQVHVLLAEIVLLTASFYAATKQMPDWQPARGGPVVVANDQA